MYNKNVAVTGRTIRETTSYDYFREDKIRMELYRYIYAIYNEGYRTFLCDMNTYIGLLAADTAIMLRTNARTSVWPLSFPRTAIRQERTICTVPCMKTCW